MPAPTAATDLTVKTVKWDESDLTLAEHMHVLEPVLLAIDPRFKNLWTHGIARERHARSGRGGAVFGLSSQD